MTYCKAAIRSAPGWGTPVKTFFGVCFVLLVVAAAALVAGCGGGASTASIIRNPSGPSAPPTAPPTGTAPQSHLLDAVYAEGYAGTTRAPSALAPYVSWAANVSAGNLAAVHAAGMFAYTYTDYMVEYSNGSSPMWAWLQSNQQYVARTCAGTKVSVSSHGGGQQVDPSSLSVFTEWQAIMSPGYDAVFVDDSGGPSYFASGTPCDAANWPQDEINGVNSVTHPPLVFNALGAAPYNAGAVTLVQGSAGSTGFLEGCYAAAGGFGITNTIVPLSPWLDMENDEIAMVNSGHPFWCYATETNANAASQAHRIFVLASFLLTYSASSVIQEAYATPSDGLNPVQPEYAVVPTQPLVAEPASISGLASGGVYYREYAACFLANTAVGPCASIVNPDSSSHANPLSGKYAHSLLLSGGGVFDGGSATLSGPASPSTIGPGSAAILN